MGARGPRPKHPTLKQLEGNPGKRRIDAAVVEAAGNAIAPEHLGAAAKSCVDQLIASMPPRFYTDADVYALSAFAAAWDWHRRAVIETNNIDFQPVVEGSKGQAQPNPWFKILKAMSEEMRSWGDRLGANPTARAAIRGPEQPSEPKSKFSGLVSIKGGRSE